jgi:hypothetical protein
MRSKIENDAEQKQRDERHQHAVLLQSKKIAWLPQQLSRHPVRGGRPVARRLVTFAPGTDSPVRRSWETNRWVEGACHGSIRRFVRMGA